MGGPGGPQPPYWNPGPPQGSGPGGQWGQPQGPPPQWNPPSPPGGPQYGGQPGPGGQQWGQPPQGPGPQGQGQPQYGNPQPGYQQPGTVPFPGQQPPYGPPGAGPQPGFGPPPAPRKRRRGLIIALAVVAVLVIAGAVTGTVLFLTRSSPPTDADKITAVTKSFAQAVDTNNATAAAKCFCAAEAAEQLELDQSQNVGDPDASTEKSGLADKITLSKITVHGDVASAQVSVGSTKTEAIYYRRENGEWKICDGAKDEADQTGS